MVQGRGGRGLGLLSVQMSVEMGEERINIHFSNKINLAGFADGIKGDYNGGRKVKDFFWVFILINWVDYSNI